MEKDTFYMQKALAEADKAPSNVYYTVGAVIVSEAGDVISTGYTGERLYSDTAMHAEEVAIAKAIEKNVILSGTSIYSTMEPCSERASGHTSCTELIIKNGIKEVFFGLYEPYDEYLKIHCNGQQLLEASGIKVCYLENFSKTCFASVMRNQREK